MPETRVEVRRSARRRRSVSAYRDGDLVVVMVPETMTAAEEQRWVAEMLRRLERAARRRRAPRSDAELLARCQELAAAYLGGRAQPRTVRWVPPMRTRWASCTPADQSIRISERLHEVPRWVLDYVLVHELAHLLVPGHGADFWELVRAYPRTERAIGFLQGMSAGARLGITGTDGPEDDD
ncbi:MAG TPA: M48 family metallopeptidase [Pseudonocardiaceae bacterium]|nr:M48 family metallopeptidase [Pseudonocardiaceae bacterium]